jgi:hypothetical protein
MLPEKLFDAPYKIRVLLPKIISPEPAKLPDKETFALAELMFNEPFTVTAPVELIAPLPTKLKEPPLRVRRPAPEIPPEKEPPLVIAKVVALPTVTVPEPERLLAVASPKLALRASVPFTV